MRPERQRVVDAALTWLGTPYHHAGRVKGGGGGVDCLTLLAEVYAEAGIIARPDIPYYQPEWHLHRSKERYLEGLTRYTREVAAPLPGDVAVWRFGHCYSHGAIVLNWPTVLHAHVGRCCSLENAGTALWLSQIGAKPRPVKFFSPWP